MESNRITIKPFFLIITVIILAETAAGCIILEGRYNPLMVTGTLRIAETAVILLVAQMWGGGLASLGLASSTIIPGFKKGLIVSAAFGTLTVLVFMGFFIAGYNPLTWIQSNLPSAPDEMIIFFIAGTIVGPIAEEVFFRGVLYGFFRRWGVFVAVVLSMLLFVLAHPICFAVSWPRIAGGLLFAVAYEMTGSLAAPITIHALGNLAIFSLPLLSKGVL
ncbi:MAG: CPBP family intramembrane metalloprotease [Deltaproteobacteria bacterium]|nr:CPBP family intramembrane metalloprotease [Deltaproteobacteria bacterium]